MLSPSHLHKDLIDACGLGDGFPVGGKNPYRLRP